MSDILPSGAAFDSRSLNNLKLAARQDRQAGLKGTAKQIEGLFLQMMLKSMRSATPKEGLFDNQQGEMFTSMLDQQLSQDMAGKSHLGLADAIEKSLGGASQPSAGRSKVLAPLDMTPAFFTRPLTQPFHALNVHKPAAVNEPKLPMRLEKGDSASFITHLSGPAKEVAQRSGIPHQLILAQAALESGWGRREIPTESGKPSHNLFGIKATGDWRGKTTEVTTTEYSGGVARKVKEAFRVYASYAEGLADYAHLLAKNPRYKNVTTASTPEMAAHALQQGGYATDPHYAQKLIGIIKQVSTDVNKAVNACNTDLSKLF